MRNPLYLSLIVGSVAGLLGGLFGIGGGIILVPALTLLLPLKQHTIHGTSLAIVLLISISGTIIYAFQGHLNWELILGIASGSVVGAMIGARLMAKVSSKNLRRGYAILLVVVGLRLIIWGSTHL